MKYVIDTSVDIKTYVQEQGSGKAVRLRNEYHQGAHELVAPDIFRTEMCNVLMIVERHSSAAGSRGRRRRTSRSRRSRCRLCWCNWFGAAKQSSQHMVRARP
jgi:hypothetical protein